MKNKNFLLGGYDAKSCPEKIRKTFDPFYKDIELDLPSSGVQQRMDSGRLFETIIGELWSKQLDKEYFYQVPQCDRSESSKKNREKLTLEVMKNPGKVIVIWNARLPQLKKSHRTGEPDALIRAEKSNGKYNWIPLDIKDHKVLEGTAKNKTYLSSDLHAPNFSKSVAFSFGEGTPKKSDALQLAHYYFMLEELGFSSKNKVGGIIGREEKIIWHQLSDSIYNHEVKGKIPTLDYYQFEFDVRINVAKNAIIGKAIVGPEWKSECLDCPFKTTCKDELKIDLDHITLLPGITPKRAKSHYSVGVSRIDELARLDWKTAKLIDFGCDVQEIIETVHEEGVSTSHLDLFHESQEYFDVLGIKNSNDLVKLCNDTAKYANTDTWNLAGSIDQARVYKIGKVFRQRGIDKVSLVPHIIEQDVDIEDCDGLVYLIGVRTVGRKKNGEDWKLRSEYKAFVDWSNTDDGEAKVFADFWNHIQYWKNKAKEQKWGYSAYHYTAHENSAFISLAKKHQGKAGVPTVAEVREFIESDKWIDLHKVISTELIWPTENVTLKEIAKWVRFSWRDSDPSGGNSIAWYKDAIGSDEESVREANRNRLLEYNADDCQAQSAIRNWIYQINEINKKEGKKLPNISSLDNRFRKKIFN
jgi:hypothetical protein